MAEPADRAGGRHVVTLRSRPGNSDVTNNSSNDAMTWMKGNSAEAIEQDPIETFPCVIPLPALPMSA
jgi:hypothetical protein